MRTWTFILFALFWSCQNPFSVPEPPPIENRLEGKKAYPSALENGKFFTKNGERFLYGGEDSAMHFQVSNLILNESQFHFGKGRESFPALIQPKYHSIHEADSIWSDTSLFLLAEIQGEVKAWSIKDLTRHELINDSLGNTPVAVVYCILADFPGVYTRKYGDQVLTFGLSGYTYYDEIVMMGLDGFILWDRETESLWWPLINKAVAGPLNQVPMLKLPKRFWKTLEWKDLKSSYPHAQILIPGQDYKGPIHWKDSLDTEVIKSKYLKN